MNNTHHHGPLAGAHWKAITVLAAAGMILIACRQQLGQFATVAMWLGIILLCYAAVWVMMFGALRMRYHYTHPETLVRYRPVLQAEVMPPATPSLPAPALAELPPPALVIHNHFHTPEAAAAAIRAITDGRQP